MPKDEFINKRLELPEVTGSTGRIIVRGYDTERPLKHVKRELKRLYASCGKITDIHIPTLGESLLRYGFIYFLGEGAVEKALQHNGTDMGGWTVCAIAKPFTEGANRRATANVQGFDTSDSKIDIKCVLSELFSSCGKIKDIKMCNSSAVVCVEGEAVAKKVQKLDGIDMGDCKLSVRLIAYQGEATRYPRHPFYRRCGRRGCRRA